MKKKLLVVSHRPIYGVDLLKKELEEVFFDLFDINHIVVKDEENILIPQENLNIDAVYYTADSHFSIISRTMKYFENIPMARNYPTRDGYIEIEGVNVFIDHNSAKNFFLNKLN